MWFQSACRYNFVNNDGRSAVELIESHAKAFVSCSTVPVGSALKPISRF